MVEDKYDKKRVEGYRALPGEERVRIALGLGVLVRGIARAGIRNQHPEFSAEEVEQELKQRLEYGRTVHTAPRC